MPAAHLSELRALHANPIGNESMVGELARSPYLCNLRQLHLVGGGEVTEADADALVRSPLAPNLRELCLVGLSEDVQRILWTAKSLSGLTELTLTGKHRSQGEGIVGRLISEAGHLENLRRLSVSGCRLGDEGATLLAQSPHLAGLTYLDVSNNTLSPAGLEALAKSPYLGNACKLVIGYYHRLPQETRAALQERFGEVG